jgi:hypothetical protein
MFLMRSCLPAVLGTLATLLLSSSAQAQLIPLEAELKPAVVPSPFKWTIPHGVLFFNTNVGSFKIMGNDKAPAEGQLDFTFKGTVLFSDLDPNSVLKVSGNVRREIHDTKYRKDVYFGQGRITVVGRFRAIQFFGRDMRARFDGFGVVRAVGEFDKNLDTGRYWYQGDPRKEYWQTALVSISVPRWETPKPKIKIQGGG